MLLQPDARKMQNNWESGEPGKFMDADAQSATYYSHTKIWVKDALNKVSRKTSAEERREQVGGRERRSRESFAASHVRLCFTHNPPSVQLRVPEK